VHYILEGLGKKPQIRVPKDADATNVEKAVKMIFIIAVFVMTYGPWHHIRKNSELVWWRQSSKGT
jgi:hypothetical protein